MENPTLQPSDYVNIDNGDGLNNEELSYDRAFSLMRADGSGNPTDDSGANQKSFYNKDLDLVQNMRNCFSVVAGFKEQVDSIVLASGYGGWTIITEDVAPEDRIEGLMYLRVVDVRTGINAEGEEVPRYKLLPEMPNKVLLSYYSDADISVYDNSNSYYLSADTVREALDELSNRSKIIKVTVNPASFTHDSSDQDFGPYYFAYVDVPGILATDYPIVTLGISDDTSSNVAAQQIAAAGHISRIQTLNGQIVVYCYDDYKPECQLPLVLRILRGGNDHL